MCIYANMKYVIISMILISVLVTITIATIIVYKKISVDSISAVYKNVDNNDRKPFVMPLHTDSNGILLGTIKYNGTSILVCVDSGSDFMVLANRDCSGCDMNMGSLVSPARISQQGSYDTIYFGTQKDSVKFQKIPVSMRGYSLDSDSSEVTVSFLVNTAITVERQGSSNYNIFGIGKPSSPDSLVSQLPYKCYMMMVASSSGCLVMYNRDDPIYKEIIDHMVYVPSLSRNLYSITPLSISIGERIFSGYDLVIDTGSNMLTLPSSMYSAFESSPNKNITISLASNLSLNIREYHLSLNGQSLVDKNEIGNFSNKVIIGSLYFKNMAIAFEQDRIGFATLSSMPRRLTQLADR